MEDINLLMDCRLMESWIRAGVSFSSRFTHLVYFIAPIEML